MKDHIITLDMYNKSNIKGFNRCLKTLRILIKIHVSVMECQTVQKNPNAGNPEVNSDTLFGV